MKAILRYLKGRNRNFGLAICRDLARAVITDPLVASVARRLGGEAIWSGMKRDAELAVLDQGAATYPRETSLY